MLKKRLEWIQVVQDQINVQQATEKLEALVDLVGALVFEVTLQLNAQAIVAEL